MAQLLREIGERPVRTASSELHLHRALSSDALGPTRRRGRSLLQCPALCIALSIELEELKGDNTTKALSLYRFMFAHA
eukprot:5243481-Prymnesium_polylepis.1